MHNDRSLLFGSRLSIFFYVQYSTIFSTCSFDIWLLNSSLVWVRSPSFLIWWWLGRNFAMGIGRRLKISTVLLMTDNCFFFAFPQHILLLYCMIRLKCHWVIKGEAFFYKFYSLLKPGYLWVFSQDWCCKPNPWRACWLGIGCFHCADDDEQNRVLRFISFISKQLWLSWLGSASVHYCGCIYSIVHSKVEKTSSEDDLRYGERQVHHNKGQPMSRAHQRWEWVDFLQRSTIDHVCRFS